MQDIANAPWEDGGMTRDDYIAFVKNQELQEEKNQQEPSKLEVPQHSEIGIQVDPPPQERGTQMTPPSARSRART